MGNEDEAIVKRGQVTAIERDRFTVELVDQDHTVSSYLSGKIRTNDIEIEMFDHVKVAISPYDLTRGRIIHRYEDYDPDQYDDST